MLWSHQGNGTRPLCNVKKNVAGNFLFFWCTRKIPTNQIKSVLFILFSHVLLTQISFYTHKNQKSFQGKQKGWFRILMNGAKTERTTVRLCGGGGTWGAFPHPGNVASATAANQQVGHGEAAATELCECSFLFFVVYFCFRGALFILVCKRAWRRLNRRETFPTRPAGRCAGAGGG